jgi:HlyD family secretion protein
MKTRTTLLADVVVASLAGLGFWYGAWAQNELDIHKEATAPQRYLTAPVEEGEIHHVVTATGTLNAIVNVEVGSQLSGQIAEVFVDFNDDVKRGQPLARLDQRSFKAHVDEARAAVDLADANISMARAKLERARIDSIESEAQNAVLKARLDNAQVQLDSARAEFGRKQALVKKGTASVVELEDAGWKRASAEAAVREAEANVAVHKHEVAGAKADVGRIESELETAIDNLAQQKARLQLAQIDLERTTIRSPIDGVIVGRQVNEGQTLATDLEAKTLFTVAGDLRQMQIEANVDEADISMLKVGQPATFTVDAYPGRQFRAKVRQIRKAPEVQQNVVTYTVVLSAANEESLLLPGMTALVGITVNKTGTVLKVPLAALRFSPKGDHHAPEVQSEDTNDKSAVLWVVGENGELKPLSVGLGEADENDAAVVRGALANGDLVVVGEAAKPDSKHLFGIRIGL